MRLPESVDTPLRTIFCILVLPPGLILASLLGLVLALFGATQRRVNIAYTGYARFCLLMGATRLEVAGLKRLDLDRAYVIVSNHESNWDLPAIAAGLSKLIVRYVAKKQVMQIPIFGQALRLTGNVRVVRTQTAKDIERIRKGMMRRAKEVSVLFFAEGTRSRDGALQAFKKGAFATAIGFGIPILPIAIAGTRAIWPKGKVRLRRGPVAIEVGEPIPTEGLTLDDRTSLRDQTFAVVSQLREAAQSRVRGWGVDPQCV